jgi:carbonic anhydrase
MKRLLKGLRDFKSSYFCSHQDLFEQLSHGQHPRVLFITCSDSRIDPNLLTQTGPGELFVIRNAGNIIPTYGSTNGGEGATIEYAIHALGIQDIIVCGHSHCGAMKGLLKMNSLEEDMPLVHDWLKHAEATRRLIKESYGHLEGEDLLDITIAENVLTQIENLKTYPIVHSRLHQGKLRIFAWIFDIDTGEVMAYDVDNHAYVEPHTQLAAAEIGDEVLTGSPACDIPNSIGGPNGSSEYVERAQHAIYNALEGDSVPGWLSPEQAERIYRGSHAR